MNRLSSPPSSKTMIASRLLAALLLSACCVVRVFAQTPAAEQPSKGAKPAALAVTAAPTERGVRFTTVGSADKLRLEVYDAAGEVVLDTGFHPGSLLDWALVDARGQAVPDGAYTCVLTAHDLAGALRVKQGGVAVAGGRASLELPDAAALGGGQQNDAGQTLTKIAPDETPSMTVTAHTGREGRVVSTRGALSFRVGNLFAGADRELMRLDEDGTVSVSGSLRAAKGVEFPDGTVQTTGLSGRKDEKGNIIPASVGAGSQNRVAKWLDNAGTLGDSALYEAGGQVGLGTSAPASLLHLSGPSGVAAITFDTPGNQRFRFQTVPGVPNWGALTLNANYNGGWFLDDPATNGYFFKLDTRGGNSAGVNNGLWLYRVPAGANPHTDESPLFGVTNGLAFFAGSVGVGTLSPTSKLEVKTGGFGITQTDGTVRLSTLTDTLNGAFGTVTNHSLKFFTNNTNQMAITAAGNVGVGTASPSNKFAVDLGSGAPVDSGITIQGSTSSFSDIGLRIKNTGPGGSEWYIDSTGTGSGYGPSKLAFVNTPGSFPPVMTLTSGGSVGIGTSAPSQKLTVQTPTANYGLVHTDGTVEVGTFVGAGATGTPGGWFGTRTNHPLRFFTGDGSASMTVDTTGNISQPAANNGLVKAMLYVNQDGTIVRCYNSQATGAAAFTAPCGFSITRVQAGYYTVHANFIVDTRFFSVSFASSSSTLATSIGATDAGTYDIIVTSVDYTGTFKDAAFHLIVF